MALVLVSAGVVGCLGGESSDDDIARSSDEFVALTERPLELPRAPAGEFGGGCFGAGNFIVGAIGLRGVPGEAALGPWPGQAELERGPVYVAHVTGPPRVVILSAARPVPGSRWPAIDMFWVSRPSYDGPVLIRGARVDRAGRLGFGRGVRPREDLRLPAGAWPRRGMPETKQPLGDGWRATVVPIRIRVPASQPGGCYALQIDGLDFSYVLPFGVQH